MQPFLHPEDLNRRIDLLEKKIEEEEKKRGIVSVKKMIEPSWSKWPSPIDPLGLDHLFRAVPWERNLAQRSKKK
jgi:hypothetical protein